MTPSESRAPTQLTPTETLDPDRFMDYEKSVTQSRLVNALAASIDRPGMRVADVGGATGVLLHAVGERAAHPFDATVIEVSDYYRDRLVQPEIDFVVDSIVECDLAANTFDIVTCRHILHHLVGDSVKESRELQARAIAQLIRITRPGGHVIFEEQVNLVGLFSRAVYHLSKLANRTRIRWRFFEAGSVVISFLTPSELSSMVGAHATRESVVIEREELSRRRVELRWRLTLLMSRGGDMLYSLRKQR